jgi:hypothetical protein
MTYYFKLENPDGTPADPPTLRSVGSVWMRGRLLKRWTLLSVERRLATLELLAVCTLRRWSNDDATLRVSIHAHVVVTSG